MQDVALLQWQIAMGADEAVMDEITNHTQTKDVALSTQTNVGESVRTTSPVEAVSQAKSGAEACKNLSELEEAVADFSALSIKKTANSTIFLQGNKESRVVVITDLPNSEDDMFGDILTGAEGRLWDQASAYVGINRQNSCIIPTVFWRTPGNRRPTENEVQTCLPFLKKALCFIVPEHIIFLGSGGYNALLSKKETIAKLSGREEDINSVLFSNNLKNKGKITRSIVLQHPATLLKKPEKKAEFWQNLLKIENIVKNN